MSLIKNSCCSLQISLFFVRKNFVDLAGGGENLRFSVVQITREAAVLNLYAIGGIEANREECEELFSGVRWNGGHVHIADGLSFRVGMVADTARNITLLVGKTHPSLPTEEGVERVIIAVALYHLILAQIH